MLQIYNKKLFLSALILGILFFNVAHAQSVEGIAQKILDLVIRPFVSLLLTLATLVFIYGIIEYIIKSDNEEGRSSGRRHMIWGIIGLTIMLSAASLVYVLENFWSGIP